MMLVNNRLLTYTLLRILFKKHLIESGIDENHIIEMSFDLFDNIDYRDPRVFYPWDNELRMRGFSFAGDIDVT